MRLDLGFSRQSGRTALARRVHTWPFHVGRVFYRDGEDPATIIVQSGSGSIIAGDRIEQEIRAGKGASVVVRSQGAMTVHRAHDEQGARETARYEAEDGAWLDVANEPRILFGGADYLQRTVLAIAGAGRVVAVESVVFHSEPGPITYGAELVVEVGGVEVAVERTRMYRRATQAMRFTAFAVVAAVGVSPEPDSAWRDWCHTNGGPTAYGSIAAMPDGWGITAKVAAVDGRRLRSAVASAYEIATRR